MKRKTIHLRYRLPGPQSIGNAKVFGPKHADGGEYGPLFDCDPELTPEIVRAVNCHDALVTLAKEVARWDSLGIGRIGLVNLLAKHRKMAKEALALLRKKNKA